MTAENHDTFYLPFPFPRNWSDKNYFLLLASPKFFPNHPTARILFGIFYLSIIIKYGPEKYFCWKKMAGG
jgi:hypothetical protein